MTRILLTTRSDKFVLDHSALKERPLAAGHDIRNVENWLRTYDSAIDSEESSFIKQKDDLTNLVPKARTPLRRALEKVEAFRWSRLFQRVPNSYDSEKGEIPYYEYDPSVTRYQSDKRIDAFVTIVVCIIGFAMLIAPLWILLYVESPARQLGIITGFIALFLGLIQSVTVAKPFESLAATAA
jgi:hypothetical protein